MGAKILFTAKSTLLREDKQLHYYQPSWAVALSEGNPCLTSKAILGYCTAFRNCYPYFKLPDLSLWEAWVLGNYDTCTYFNPDGRQLFGVCCTNSPTPTSPSEQPPPLGVLPIDQSSQTENETNDGQSKDSIYQNWPPPIPTHPPWMNDITTKKPVSIVQWPPPIPTHPPDHSYPTHPTQRPPPSPVGVITSTNKPQTTNIPWPPPIPTHPPTTSTAKPPVYPAATNPPSSGAGFQATCGAKNGGTEDQERIVGGQNASPNEWPWVAVLFNSGRQFCGGSLITTNHVLTAAHCVAQMNSWDVARLTANLGDHNIRSSTEVRHVERKIKRVVRHKGFDFSTLYNDVAVLTLDQPVIFTQTIRPICLPSASSAKAYSGQTGVVVGWGSIRENGPQPAILQKVSVPIWSNAECARKYGAAAPAGIIKSMICAGKSAKDSCSGDSGGPLAVKDGPRWVLVGIVSWGIGCGKGQYPGVYTRVSEFLPWITKNLNSK